MNAAQLKSAHKDLLKVEQSLASVLAPVKAWPV